MPLRPSHLLLAFSCALSLSAIPRTAHAAWSNDDLHTLDVAPGAGGVLPDGQGALWARVTAGVLRVRPDGTQPFAPVSVHTEASYHDNMSPDGNGGVVVAWLDGGPANRGILAQRVDSTGATLWTADGVSVSTDSGSGNVGVCDVGGGSTAVLWDAPNHTLSDTIKTRVLRPDGTPAGDAIVLTTAGQFLGEAVGDGSGGLYATWSTNGGPSRLQHVIASSAIDPAWPADGLVIGASIVVPDDAGGVFTVAVSGQTVTLDRIGPDAAPVAGWPVTLSTNGSVEVSLARDGAGGVWVAWTTPNGGSNNVLRAAHYSGSGVSDPALPSGGAVLLGGTSAFSLQVVPSDATHAAVVVYGAVINGIEAVWLPLGSGGPGWGTGRSVFRTVGGTVGAAWCGGGLLIGLHTRADLGISRVDASGYLGIPMPDPITVGDVRPDQGGLVNVVWPASYLDPLGAIDHYVLERGVTNTGGGPWVPVATRASNELAHAYSATASTGADSTGAGIPLVPFRVVAYDTAGYALMSSVVSGYSTDDIAPDTPAGFAGGHDASHTELFWEAATAADLCCYHLYRGDTSGFPLDPAHQIAQTTSTTYDDIGPVGGYYALTAVDVHGNESVAATLSPDQFGAAGVGDGGALTRAVLEMPSPSPAHGTTTLRFGAPRGMPLRLEAFDIGGRRVRTLVDSAGDGTEHAIAWDLRDQHGTTLANGLYLVRMTASGTRTTRRLAITR